MERHQISLAKIAAASALSPIFAHDCVQGQHTLIRLQRLCATNLAHMGAIQSFFNKGQFDIVLRSAPQELAVSLSTYPQKIERGKRKMGQYRCSEAARLVAIHDLCALKVSSMMALTPSRAAESLPSKAA